MKNQQPWYLVFVQYRQRAWPRGQRLEQRRMGSLVQLRSLAGMHYLQQAWLQVQARGPESP